MNLAQIRVAIRDILTAGSGMNTTIRADTFWTDSEINLAINRAQDEIYKVIRRARADYFTRILRTTDPVFSFPGQRFDPATLRWSEGNGNYAMPLDFVRMKLITDLSADRVRVSAGDLSRSEFRILMNEQASGAGSEYLYDIVGNGMMLVRPIPQDVRDFEFVYEKRLPQMRDITNGLATVVDGATTVLFSNPVTSLMLVGDELITGYNITPDPNLQYNVIKSIDSPTQVTLEGYPIDPNSDIAGNGGPTGYRVSSCSEIPRHHHQLLVCLAASYCFKKGTNPHLESAQAWRDEYDAMLPSLVNEVESRQGSDIETAQEYLGDDYD